MTWRIVGGGSILGIVGVLSERPWRELMMDEYIRPRRRVRPRALRVKGIASGKGRRWPVSVSAIFPAGQEPYLREWRFGQ